MYSGLLYGALEAAAVVCLALAWFFINAWRTRRQHSEYVLFAMLLAVLAIMAALEGLLYRHSLLPGTPGSLPGLMRLIAACARVVPALLLHFALRDVRSPYERPVMTLTYLLTAPLLVVALSGHWLRMVADHMHIIEWMPGIRVHALELRLSNIAKVALFPQAAMYVGALWLLARHYRRSGRESLAAVLGVALLTITDLHDIVIAFGLATFPLMPVGMVALAYGVSLTLVARFGRLTRTLHARTELLHQRTQQLQQSYEELEAAHHELERGEQMALVGELAAVVAHQVRNPLAVVGNAISSLRRRQLPASDQRMLHGIIKEELDRLQALVAHLLDYSRPVAPRGELIDIAALARRGLAVVQERAAVSYKVQCNTVDKFIQGDAELLLEAFENIATNAGQAMPQGGCISVLIEDGMLAGRKAVRIHFRDEGHGMSKEQLEQAYRPFYTSRPTGTGLGLPLVARIIEAHGGIVGIDSQPGEGTVVTIQLPRSHLVVRRPTTLTQSGDALSVLP